MILEYVKRLKCCVDIKERLVVMYFFATVQLVGWGNVTFQGRVQMLSHFLYNAHCVSVCFLASHLFSENLRT